MKADDVSYIHINRRRGLELVSRFHLSADDCNGFDIEDFIKYVKSVVVYLSSAYTALVVCI